MIKYKVSSTFGFLKLHKEYIAEFKDVDPIRIVQEYLNLIDTHNLNRLNILTNTKAKSLNKSISSGEDLINDEFLYIEGEYLDSDGEFREFKICYQLIYIDSESNDFKYQIKLSSDFDISDFLEFKEVKISKARLSIEYFNSSTFSFIFGNSKVTNEYVYFDYNDERFFVNLIQDNAKDKKSIVFNNKKEFLKIFFNRALNIDFDINHLNKHIVK